MMRILSVCTAVAAALSLSVACSDDDSASVKFERDVLFMQPGETATVRFSGVNITNFYLSSTPEGWKEQITLDKTNRTLTITAPDPASEEAPVASGDIVLAGNYGGGSVTTASLHVAIAETIDLTAQPANCYIASKKNTRYKIDVGHKGDGRTAIPTASVSLIWGKSSSLLKYMELENNTLTFYINENDGKIVGGNALIGAYDANGALLWSWHIWVADFDAEATAITNGDYTLMARNLGALEHGNATTDDIRDSYGLYYQWGRKEPFIGPSTYNVAKDTEQNVYDPEGNRAPVIVEKASESGTAAYAAGHPRVFLTGEKENAYDWLQTADASRWSATSKSIEDPCPYGWRVAPAAAFEGIEIAATPTADDYDTYGWMMRGDGFDESLFIGAGRRRYDNGAIQNLYVNPVEVRNAATEAQPWEGLYWTADTEGREALAFHFWFEKKSTTGGIELAPYARANGMSVRCVREK